MALKDHPFFFVIAACCATAAVTWSVSEHLRVSPIKAQLEKQLIDSKSSPRITGLILTNEQQGNSTLVKQRFSYNDPEGDAKFLSFIVMQTNAAKLSISSSSIATDSKEQISGASTVATWTCFNGEQYYVTLRAIITDAAGNISAPKDYTVTCGG